MLPTPDTSHVSYSRIYEPAEDSFLLLDTLTSEAPFLSRTFPSAAPAPLVLEVGTGSGVVLAFINAHARTLFGHGAVVTAGVDLNPFACLATGLTVDKAARENRSTAGRYLGASVGDLASAWRRGTVDVLVFNPPYVPTPDVPPLSGPERRGKGAVKDKEEHVDADDDVDVDDDGDDDDDTWERDSYLLSLSYAGGRDGMETTHRLNRPAEVKEGIRRFGPEWRAETVGSSGKTAGWEKLQVLRIWRE
ncbi:hypothetical protein AAL_00247 [Moelleriella libera RCEF 2490]|uniref:Methyltransferase n=1 Tax=Moelleriella libera RCEF 2490 TaxID=1081109 RepID=A0A166UPA1_9HYPO|nr:hypothetical protein AAL_00247 [Moelleriella libera RCEF 2490]